MFQNSKKSFSLSNHADVILVLQLFSWTQASKARHTQVCSIILDQFWFTLLYENVANQSNRGRLPLTDTLLPRDIIRERNCQLLLWQRL